MSAYHIGEDVEPTARRQNIIALVIVGLALASPFMPTARQQQLAFLLRNSLLRPFVMIQEGMAAASLHAVSTEEFQARLDSAVSALTNQSTLAEENRRLRNLLDLSRRLGTAYLPASVLRAGTAGSESMFQLDVGSDHGIHVNAPVIASGGLIGVVREVRAGMSIGMDWTHPEFWASAMTMDGEIYGHVRVERGSFREGYRLLLDGIPFHDQLEPGMAIVTSGLGGVFPRGITVGTVDQLAAETAGWRRSYWLRPAVFPGSATHVLVAVGTMSERPADLTEVIQDSTSEGAGPIAGPGDRSEGPGS
ncbi:MAG: rod shape-determining protein MreC [Gemmatimonadetes bacterium]|nr:rod shape-determining protein MreC [Gemmatimonadota bacterium]